MKKVKLPRKRKKAFIKAQGSLDYMAACIVGELLVEQGRKHGDRFYSFGERCRPNESNPWGYKILKRW